MNCRHLFLFAQIIYHIPLTCTTFDFCVGQARMPAVLGRHLNNKNKQAQKIATRWSQSCIVFDLHYL